MIRIQSLCKEYYVRKLLEGDIEDILAICKNNPLYFEHCPPMATRESIKEDMSSLPPNTQLSQKYYIGFYQEQQLIAVMDLIEGYPKKDATFIGFFMMNPSIQQKGIGSKIIEEVCEYLRENCYSTVQLAWVLGNPQAEHFWRKNHFIAIKETHSNVADHVILAERKLMKG